MANEEKNKRWSVDEADYVRKHLGKVTLDAMAKHLGRSEMSVRLYVLRKKWPMGGLTVKRNLLVELLKTRFKNLEDFTPSRTFYKETGIGQRRYWDLYFGRKSITGKEYAAVADYFGITVREAFESRQLKLFEEEG